MAVDHSPVTRVRARSRAVAMHLDSMRELTRQGRFTIYLGY